MSALWPASCAARFEPVRLLVSGPRGEVWLARQTGLDRDAVVKLLRPQLASLSDDLLARFRTEAKVTAALAHPGIVVLIDHDADPAGAWIAYEYVPGGSLAAELAAEGPRPWRRALEVVVQVAAALTTAHAAGVIHRDVKPGNILVDGDRFKLADFGIARWDELSGTAQAGIVVGSPAYLPPEVRFGATATPASDVFALGITALELITGQTPTSLPAAGATRADCWLLLERAAPPEVAALIERATAAVVADRLPTAAAFGDAAEALLAADLTASAVRRRARVRTVRANVPPPPVRTRPDGPPTLPPSPQAHAVVAFASLALALALLFIGVALTRVPPPHAKRVPESPPASAPVEPHLQLLAALRASVETPRATLRPWFGRAAYARGAPLVLPCRGHLKEVHLTPAAGTRLLSVDGRALDLGPGVSHTLTGAALRAGVILVAAEGPVAVESVRGPCNARPEPSRTPPSLALLADELRRRFSEVDDSTIVAVKELAQRELAGREEVQRRAVTALLDLREKAFWDKRWSQASASEMFFADHDTGWTSEAVALSLKTLPVVEPLLAPTRDPATGWLELGSILRVCGQPEAGRAALVEALGAWPESHWAWFELAKLEKYRGETPEDPPLTRQERAAHLSASLPAFDQTARLMRQRFALRRDDERYWLANVQGLRRDAVLQIGRLREHD